MIYGVEDSFDTGNHPAIAILAASVSLMAAASWGTQTASAVLTANSSLAGSAQGTRQVSAVLSVLSSLRAVQIEMLEASAVLAVNSSLTPILPNIWSAAAVLAPSISFPISQQTVQFLNRTSGLDSTHVNAYWTLIDGLVADGIWTLLDVLYIFATQNQTTALLNLVSSSFTGVANGSPNFVADRGFTGVDASATVFINSQFNPTTAPSPHFTTNSCHASAWADTAITSGASGGVIIGQNGASNNNQTAIYPRYSDGNTYLRINDSAGNLGGTPNASTSVGHWLISRTGASTSTGYKNGSSISTPNNAAGTLVNLNMYILAVNNNGSASTGSACQITMASIGAGLDSTQTTNFYNRLRTYMTAVGVP